ncbi:MAG: IPTL-CTERM sorting domain-containing protein [bacterium]
MLFNGTSDYIEIPDAPAFSSHELGEITVMGWVNVAAFATDGHGQARQPIMSKGNVGFWEWALYVYDDGSVGFSTWTQGGSSHNEISGGQISTGTWHHVAGTFVDGVINQVYLDGLPVTASTNFSGSAYDGSVNPRIGSRADGQFLNAVIDDVRVYDNHMDGNQIREAAGIPVQPVPTLSQWALILMAMLIAMVGVARTYRA